MSRWADLPFLVLMLGAVALLCWIPAAHATVMRDHHTAQAFFYAGLMLFVVTVMLALATTNLWSRDPVYAQLAALAGAYIVLPLAMALPLGLSVADTSWFNAWFEMLSAFTTTGATLYDVDRLPQSVHLWRGLCGWFGGFFVLLCAYAVLSPINLGGAEVVSGRGPGRAARGARLARPEEHRMRLLRHVGLILPVYTAATLALWLMLLIAGENGLAALCHAMGTLSTSGILSTQGPAAGNAGIAGESLMFFFMCLALSRHLMPFPGIHHQRVSLRDDPELRLGLLLIGTVIAIMLLRHFMVEAANRESESLLQFLRAFWGSAFSAASFLTTTGYISQSWASAREWAGDGGPGLILLGLAIVGGGVATTAGGVTLLRVYALYLHSKREIERIIHPHAVIGGGAETRRLAQNGAYMAWVFFMLFAITLSLVMAALTVAGLEFTEAVILSVAALTTTGPLAVVAGPEPISYAVQSTPVKTILAMTMVLGRIETIALIALLAPANWRR